MPGKRDRSARRESYTPEQRAAEAIAQAGRDETKRLKKLITAKAAAKAARAADRGVAASPASPLRPEEKAKGPSGRKPKYSAATLGTLLALPHSPSLAITRPPSPSLTLPPAVS